VLNLLFQAKLEKRTRRVIDIEFKENKQSTAGDIAIKTIRLDINPQVVFTET